MKKLITLILVLACITARSQIIPDTIYANDGAVKYQLYYNLATCLFTPKTFMTDSLNVIRASIATKQATLVSGTNIKTVNGNSLLGSGDISISSAVAWGNITGTLSDQSDLNTALAGKVATTRTVNGHALSSDVTVTAGDVGLGNVTNESKATMFTNPIFTGHATMEGITATGATGNGKFVFDNTPTLVTPNIGVATATTVNKVTITAPATSSTLTIADGKTLTANGNFSIGYAKWDFSVDGGGTGTITPAITSTIPDNAVIVGGQINSTTAVTSGGTTTVAIGIANNATTTIKGATAKASYSLDGLLNVVPTFSSSVKTTAAGAITFTIATTAATAGVIEVWVIYFTAAN